MVVVGLLLLVSGCTPTCDKVCTKLIDCAALDLENTPEKECALECQLHENSYDDLEGAETDTGLHESFDDLKSCIMDESCNNLANGSCYDSDLYSW